MQYKYDTGKVREVCRRNTHSDVQASGTSVFRWGVKDAAAGWVSGDVTEHQKTCAQYKHGRHHTGYCILQEPKSATVDELRSNTKITVAFCASFWYRVPHPCFNFLIECGVGWDVHVKFRVSLRWRSMVAISELSLSTLFYCITFLGIELWHRGDPRSNTCLRPTIAILV